MKVLGIAGSLRPDSNTLQYMKTALALLGQRGLDTELLSLRGYKPRAAAPRPWR